MTRPDDRSNRAAGFSLIEVVVALTIISGGLILVQQIHGQGARGLAQAKAQMSALAAAEARLATYTATASLRPGDHAGRDEAGVDWRVSISPLRAPEDLLWRIEVTATAPTGGPVSLVTVRHRPLAERGR